MSLRRINPIIILLLVIITLASLLRFYDYAEFSFSNDELSALFRTRFDTFKQLVQKGFYVDGHPGGIQTFLFYWLKMVPATEAWVRLPFVISGIFSVWLIYLVARQWFSRISGLYCAAMVALLEFPLLYSQIARPYITGMLFVLATTYFWTRILSGKRETNRLRYILSHAGLIFFATAGLYNHYFSFLVVAAILATGILVMKRKQAAGYLISLAIIAVLFLPHVPITMNHLSIGGVGLWLGSPDDFWFFRHIFFIFNESWLVILTLAVIIVAGFILKFSKFHFNIFHLVSLLWFFIPIIIGFIYSRAVNPVLQNSVLIFSFPFLLIFIFSFMKDTPNRYNIGGLVILIVVTMLSTVVERNYYGKQHFGEFKDVAKKIVQWDNQYGSKYIKKAINVNHPWYIHYYLERYGGETGFEQYENRGGVDLLDLKNVVAHSNTDYFVYAWTKPSPDIIPDLIRFYYPYVVSKNNYDGLSEVALYSKDSAESHWNERVPFSVFFTGFEKQSEWKYDPSFIDTLYRWNGENSFCVDTGLLYGPTFDMKISDLKKGHDAVYLRISLMSLAFEPQYKSHLVFSVDSEEGVNRIWKATNLEYFLSPGEWSPVYLRASLPADEFDDDRIKVYLWNSNNSVFFIDDFKIECYDSPL